MQKPIIQVAKGYGLCGRGLGKLCAKHQIAVPPRGYWQKVKISKLEKISNLDNNNIILKPKTKVVTKYSLIILRK